MSKINFKCQDKGDLTKGAFSVSFFFLVFNQTSNNFFETPCIMQKFPRVLPDDLECVNLANLFSSHRNQRGIEF